MARTEIKLGRDATGRDLCWVPSQAPHLLVCGSTGGGKTSLLRLILARWPYDVVLLDGKGGVEFGSWSGPRVRASAGEVVRIAKALAQVKSEVQRRCQLLIEERAVSFVELGSHMPSPILVLLDEAAVALAMPADGESPKETRARTDQMRADLLTGVMLARSVGISYVLGLQRPDAAFLDTAVKDNMGKIGVGYLSSTGARMFHDSAEVADLYVNEPGRGVAQRINRNTEVPVAFHADWLSHNVVRELYESA